MSGRALLRPEVDRDAIDAAAAERGWPLLNILRRREDRPRQMAFGTSEWLLTFVEDPRVGARYVIAHGHDVETLMAEVREALPTVGLGDVLAVHQRDRARGVTWLGVVGPPSPAEPFSTLLAAASKSRDPTLVQAAELAYAMLGWR